MQRLRGLPGSHGCQHLPVSQQPDSWEHTRGLWPRRGWSTTPLLIQGPASCMFFPLIVSHFPITWVREDSLGCETQPRETGGTVVTYPQPFPHPSLPLRLGHTQPHARCLLMVEAALELEGSPTLPNLKAEPQEPSTSFHSKKKTGSPKSSSLRGCGGASTVPYEMGNNLSQKGWESWEGANNPSSETLPAGWNLCQIQSSPTGHLRERW